MGTPIQPSIRNRMAFSPAVTVLALVVVGFIDDVSACSCMLTNAFDTYCDADFVVKAKVRSISERPMNDTINEIRIFKVYKSGDLDWRRGDIVEVFTPGLWNSCYFLLTSGETYLFFGYVYNDQPNIGICPGFEQWSSVPWNNRRALSRLSAETWTGFNIADPF